MDFMNALEQVVNEDFNISVTKNGAIGYATTGKSLLDLNFAVSSLRDAPDEKIIKMFTKAYSENPELAVRWLFFARDIRGGLGERNLFRVILQHYHGVLPSKAVKELIKYVPEYGRFDDLWVLLDDECMLPYVIEFVEGQLTADLTNLKLDKPVSLLAKWMPSINTSSQETRRYAKILMTELKLNPKLYRKMLTKLRRHIKIVEQQMSANNWGEIEYSAVPSKANLLYKDAFLRHDYDRRHAFLNDVASGNTTINSKDLFPHEIIRKYRSGDSWFGDGVKEYDRALEQLWKNLPDNVHNCSNTIVVADGSGSMYSNWYNNKVLPIDVSAAMAIYFAERSSGEFKDKFITFSNKPQLVDLSNCQNLRDKIQYVLAHNEMTNTNITAVFKLILDTAISHHMEQSELPENILIVSDMEFDGSVDFYEYDRVGYTNNHQKLFNQIKRRFEDAGYKMPRVVFWNVCSRTGTIPVKENDLGVALISGFSTNAMRMVMSQKLDPYEVLVETLMDKRYDAVAFTFNDAVA